MTRSQRRRSHSRHQHPCVAPLALPVPLLALPVSLLALTALEVLTTWNPGQTRVISLRMIANVVHHYLAKRKGCLLKCWRMTIRRARRRMKAVETRSCRVGGRVGHAKVLHRTSRLRMLCKTPLRLQQSLLRNQRGEGSRQGEEVGRNPLGPKWMIPLPSY